VKPDLTPTRTATQTGWGSVTLGLRRQTDTRRVMAYRGERFAAEPASETE